MPYSIEFPDFDEMPAIPASWTDVSWHNDTCPSFETETGLRIYVDYANESLREFRDCKRFIIMSGDYDSDTLLETDDWEEVLTFTHGRVSQ